MLGNLEREKRARNVIFTGDVTKDKVDTFLQTAKVESPTKVLEISTAQNKKLYIVSMVQEKEKWALIGKARSISQSSDSLNNIYVNPDLTKTERDAQYLLRQEVRRRRQLGENVKIKKELLKLRARSCRMRQNLSINP